MRILITNDDGIHAYGLSVLEDIARQISSDIYVVAPESDQSGVAHSLSLNDPLRLREISPRHFAVKGTPTDCVLMGVRHILKDKKPDLILSGVNYGHNVAEDVTYSGTIAGAIEGTLLGIPSFALSQMFRPLPGRKELYWDCARIHASPIILKTLHHGLPPQVLINLNFPDCLPEEVQRVHVSVQGRRSAECMMYVEERLDGRNNPYYWLKFSEEEGAPHTGTDLAALAAKEISLTPLRIDLTDTFAHAHLTEVFKGHL